MSSTGVSAAGLLLWATHALLKEHQWVRKGDPALQDLRCFTGNVNLLPTQSYQLQDEIVDVRAILVGAKLFVHFVSPRTSVQLGLKVSEYVKPCSQGQELVPEGVLPPALVVCGWRCNVQVLRWRTERNLFPEFAGGVDVVTSDAELSRLPELLLVRIGGFLSAPEFCQLTQTSKYLHRLQDTTELWEQFLLRDFPTAQPEGDPRALYKTRWTHQRQMEAWSRYDRARRLHEYMLRQQFHWRWRGGGRLPPAPWHLPIPLPFLPVGDDPWSLRPPQRPDFIDEDLELSDPFELDLDPPFLHFY